MIQPIHIINPNSLEDVTGRIARAVRTDAPAGGPGLHCVTLETAPPGIVSQRDADAAAPLVAGYVERNDACASAFVIACYSDPGLFAAREVTKKPVIGIGQAGLSAALQLGERIGVIAVRSRGIPRHLRYYRTLALDRRIVSELAIDLPVADSGDENLALQRLIETARTLRDDANADVIVLGCAGMAELRSRVEAAVGVPVVDPCTAAVAFAIARVKDHADATHHHLSQGGAL